MVDLTPSKRLNLYQLGVTIEITYSVALLTIKVSTLLFLHRIFPGKAFARKLQLTGLVTLAYTIVAVVFLSIQCLPLSLMWTIDPTAQGTCFEIRDVMVGCAIMNIVTDLAIFALPIPKLWSLQISSKQKYQLITIFLIGGL